MDIFFIIYYIKNVLVSIAWSHSLNLFALLHHSGGRVWPHCSTGAIATGELIEHGWAHGRDGLH